MERSVPHPGYAAALADQAQIRYHSSTIRDHIEAPTRGPEHVITIRKIVFTDNWRKRMVAFTVNGVRRELGVDPNTPLLWVLREHLKLTGTKFGCGIASCGACTVHIDGQATRACATPMSMVEGKSVTTIEGLSPDGSHPLQKAWIAEQVPQCGYCQSGQIMQAADLLARNKTPSRAEIVEHMDGNICRCGTYLKIISAIQRASREG
jgi:isoquinoline 1-oxidoreductase alpha subunit